jgi:dephospho-CoA kinase
MRRIGLTGSIGMGKSTTAAMFAAEGAPVYDADAAVHRLYGQGGGAVGAVAALFPSAVVDGAVDRAELSRSVLNDSEALKRLEAAVHPLMGADRAAFLERAVAEARALVVFDVPLLFETGGDRMMDAVVVVSCPPLLQQQRVLQRPGMTQMKLDAIMSRQTPDDEKRRRADFVIDTGLGLDAARDQVRRVLETLRDPNWRSSRAL